jgi:hypothetical protein
LFKIPYGSAGVPAPTEALTDEDPDVVRYAILALGLGESRCQTGCPCTDHFANGRRYGFFYQTNGTSR